MATKPDEVRALMEAVIDYMRYDIGYQPPWVNRLRDRFEAKLRGGPYPRGGTVAPDSKGVPTDRPLSEQ